LEKLLDGRVAVACGAGEYFDRYCGERSAEVFEYFVDDALAGQSRKGIPIRPLESLREERRDVCVFVFARNAGAAVLRLDELGLRWGVDIFDARVFGDGSSLAVDYRVLRSREELDESPEIELHLGPGAHFECGRIVVQKFREADAPGVFLAEDSRLETGDLILSSGSRLCCGRGGSARLGEGVIVPQNFLLNCSLHSKVNVGAAVVFSADSVVNTASHTHIEIGARCTFGPHLDFYAYAPIEIGAGCMFSSHVFVVSGAGHDLIVGGQAKLPLPVCLGESVWVGWGAKLLGGAKLGAGSVVASGSIVNRAWPSRSLVAGVPAKLVTSEIEWERDYRAYKKLFYPPEEAAQ
jgi:acetyltransferase-like isoleucine patch superfamily enzyme